MTQPEHDEGLVEQRHRDAALNACGFEDEEDLEEYGFGRSPNQVRELAEHFARFEQSIRTTDAARITELVADLEWYADQLCEHGKYSEVCGRLGPDDCFGCRARTTLRSNPDAG